MPPRCPAGRTRLSVVIVTYNSAPRWRRRCRRLCPQLRPGDELIVVDNASADGTLAAVRAARSAGDRDRRPGATPASRRARTRAPRARQRRPARVPQPGRHAGAGLRRGASAPPRRARLGRLDGPRHRRGRARGQLERRRRALHRHRVGRRGGQPAPGAWPGRARSRSSPAPALPCPRADVGARRRLRRARTSCTRRTSTSRCGCGSPGGRLGVEPAAVVDHDYEFDKGAGQMAAARAQPLGHDPALLSRRAARAARARAVGHRGRTARRGGGRRLAAAEARGRRARRCARCRDCCASGAPIQATRTICAAEFAAWLTPRLDSPFLGSVGRARSLRAAMLIYWKLVRRCLG